MPTVKCLLCPSEIMLTHDKLRELNDAGGSPVCGPCGKKPNAGVSEPTGEGRLIARDYLLLALDVFERAGRTWTTRSVLVMAVWRMAPEVFGLAKYEAVAPDSKRVDAEIFRLMNLKMTARPFQNTFGLYSPGLERLAYLRAHAAGQVTKAQAALRAEVEAKRL